jgi:hypothetical protein
VFGGVGNLDLATTGGESYCENVFWAALQAQKLADVHKPQPSPSSSKSSGDGVGNTVGLTSCSSTTLHRHSSVLRHNPQEDEPPGVGTGSISAMALTASVRAARDPVGRGIVIGA